MWLVFCDSRFLICWVRAFWWSRGSTPCIFLYALLCLLRSFHVLTVTGPSIGSEKVIAASKDGNSADTNAWNSVPVVLDGNHTSRVHEIQRSQPASECSSQRFVEAHDACWKNWSDDTNRARSFHTPSLEGLLHWWVSTNAFIWSLYHSTVKGREAVSTRTESYTSYR